MKYIIKELYRHLYRTIGSISGYAIASLFVLIILSISGSNKTGSIGILQNTGTHMVVYIPTDKSICTSDVVTGSVDIETAGEIIQYLIKLRKEKGSTIIVATHGSFSEEHADKTILLENGFIIRNPYFGESMLTCGETKETLEK